MNYQDDDMVEVKHKVSEYNGRKFDEWQIAPDTVKIKPVEPDPDDASASAVIFARDSYPHKSAQYEIEWLDADGEVVGRGRNPGLERTLAYAAQQMFPPPDKLTALAEIRTHFAKG